MIEELKSRINLIHPISEDILEEFLFYWNPVKAKKGEVLTHIDEVEKYLYFTTKGAQKAFYYTGKKEQNISFTVPYFLTCIPESFLTQSPSKYCFQCITDSEFFRISNQDFFALVNKFSEIEVFLRKALLMLVDVLTLRYQKILSSTIEERFKFFMENSSHLLQKIPQKEIANFLNMDPTNFSKLINKVKV